MFVLLKIASFLLLSAVTNGFPSSHRTLQVDDGVSYRTSTHRLYYVPSVADINYAAVGVPSDDFQDAPAHELENNRAVKIKAIAQGGTLVELSLNGTNYLWDNIEGATYYGDNTNNFPLRRGMIVNGGVRFTAVAPEHGLYYDIDWDVSIEDSDPNEKSIVLSIVDDEETRERARNLVPDKPARADRATGFSSGQFSRDGGEMTKYPTTDMEFKFTITLRSDEDFVRLRMSVTNPDPMDAKWGEAWLPMTFPINDDSVILSPQQQRWRGVNWCMDDVTPNVVEWEDYPFLHRPLDWPMGCIFYDIPSMGGNFHGITTNSAKGEGVVYYSPEESAHYTKIWSWGKQGDGNSLEGRPASDYYEPWSGATNFAFFQTSAFEPQTVLSWQIAILPISGGLTSQSKEELLGVVETHIDERMDQLGDIKGVKTISTRSEELPTLSPLAAPTEDNVPPATPTEDSIPPATPTEDSIPPATLSNTTSASLKLAVPSCCYYYSWASTLFLLSTSLLLFGF